MIGFDYKKYPQVQPFTPKSEHQDIEQQIADLQIIEGDEAAREKVEENEVSSIVSELIISDSSFRSF